MESHHKYSKTSSCVCAQLLEHQEDLRSLMSGIFKGVFVHRYRDRVPEIRAICMEEMGMWIRENPVRFLNDEHLKYVGWMLHDKVRRAENTKQ